jgi:hypothetical protein
MKISNFKLKYVEKNCRVHATKMEEECYADEDSAIPSGTSGSDRDSSAIPVESRAGRAIEGEGHMAKIRLSIEVSNELASLLDALAVKEETTKTEIVRRALSIMKAYREQSSVGRTHIGFTADPTKLDAELIGILSSPESGGDHDPKDKDDGCT